MVTLLLFACLVINIHLASCFGPTWQLIHPQIDIPSSNESIANHGGVVSESGICSRIGIDILKTGGNAADALVAINVCLGTIAMYHSGPGGGGFMLIRAPNGTHDCINFRETAPAAASAEMYNSNVNASLYGGLASGVPGELRGLEYLHENYGSLPWAFLVQPAIDLAEKGFVVGEPLVNFMEMTLPSDSSYDFFVDNPIWAEDFARDGRRIKVGEIMTRKRYANLLRMVAEHGADAFYQGWIAETTIVAVQAAGGIMTTNDLRNYSVRPVELSQIQYRGYKVSSCGAPSAGPVALNVLKVLEGYDDFGQSTSINLSTHRLDEALKWGFGLRTLIGDPFFVPGVNEYAANMTSEAVAAEIRSKILDDHTLDISVYNPDNIEILPTPGTAHVVTMDCSGMTISTTETINTFFGSHVMVPETGLIMNNEMSDFSIPGSSDYYGIAPSPHNLIVPGKTPLSTQTPIIVEHLNDSRVVLGAGGAGGARILTATIQVVLSMLDGGLSPSEAISKPRMHDQLSPNQVEFDWTYNNATVAFMASRGHNVSWVSPGIALVQAIRRLPNGTIEAANDQALQDGGGFAY